MSKQTCKHCGSAFNYCRACVFKPIYYHDAGFCSEKCCTEYRLAQQQTPVVELKQEEVVEIQPLQIIEEIFEIEADEGDNEEIHE